MIVVIFFTEKFCEFVLHFSTNYDIINMVKYVKQNIRREDYDTICKKSG